MRDIFKAKIKGRVLFEEPLDKYTSYRIGGKASVLVFPEGLSDLKEISKVVQENSLSFAILGAGTNTLVSDRGFSGVVIKTTRMNLEFEEKIKDEDEIELRVGASVPNSVLLQKSIRNGWRGLEFLTGVPGSVGGAVFMNAGTYAGETKDRLLGIEVFSILNGLRKITDLEFSYRKNHSLKKGDIVYSTQWKVTSDQSETIEKKIKDHLERRKKTQPVDQPSCGSVFKNPPCGSAWSVLDALGLRGFSVGGAQFSEKHPNFIVNVNQARAADVIELIRLAKVRAKEQMGIELEEEVKYLGF